MVMIDGPIFSNILFDLLHIHFFHSDTRGVSKYYFTNLLENTSDHPLKRRLKKTVTCVSSMTTYKGHAMLRSNQFDIKTVGSVHTLPLLVSKLFRVLPYRAYCICRMHLFPFGAPLCRCTIQ